MTTSKRSTVFSAAMFRGWRNHSASRGPKKALWREALGSWQGTCEGNIFWGFAIHFSVMFTDVQRSSSTTAKFKLPETKPLWKKKYARVSRSYSKKTEWRKYWSTCHSHNSNATSRQISTRGENMVAKTQSNRHFCICKNCRRITR